jgi:hypothetical protein
MKSLQKPLAVGLLALLAVGVVFYQVIWPRWFGKGNRAPQSTVATVAPGKKSASGEAPPPKSNSSADAVIEKDVVQARFQVWLDSPARDPFQLNAPIMRVERGSVAVVSPIPSWKLRGIWRQTGSRLAAINLGVYAEGDTVEGFKLERIDADQVWIQGPAARERLGFDKLELAAAAAPAGTNFINRLLGPEKQDLTLPR